ncbi:hypothetical protein [Sodalis sp.]|uniref:hypothetical protein n=1 Tax=Sodalis sp. (in: enterobacteria) TaxID=1898979 RepID=UPI003872E527
MESDTIARYLALLAYGQGVWLLKRCRHVNPAVIERNIAACDKLFAIAEARWRSRGSPTTLSALTIFLSDAWPN